MKRILSLLLSLVLILSLASCASTKKKSGDEATATDLLSAVELNGDSDGGKAGALQTVYFPFDSSDLSDATKATLDANSEFLTKVPSVTVQVEGHADERGSIQYNLALGERRAKAVLNYLVSKGIDAARITTISMGKEKPVAFGHDEESWSKNRRGNFVITAK